MSKVTLGYPTRTAAVLALKQGGVPSAEIAARIGITVSQVAALVSSYNRNRERRGEPAASNRNWLDAVPAHVRSSLRGPATLRGTTVDRLIVDIITKVAEDGLTDAVLDDHDQSQGAAA